MLISEYKNDNVLPHAHIFIKDLDISNYHQNIKKKIQHYFDRMGVLDLSTGEKNIIEAYRSNKNSEIADVAKTTKYHPETIRKYQCRLLKKLNNAFNTSYKQLKPAIAEMASVGLL